jgi:uncharacterized protein YkwD
MDVLRVLRPAQRLLTGAVVTAVASICLVSAPTGTSAAPARSDQPAQVTPVAQRAYPALSTGSYERQVLSLINATRKKHHLRAVKPAGCAIRVANRWSAYLAAHNAFRHQSMQTLLRRCHAKYVGEILGRGNVAPATLVKMWLNSPPHRHVLLRAKPAKIGIGATPNARGEWVVAVNFMRL